MKRSPDNQIVKNHLLHLRLHCGTTYWDMSNFSISGIIQNCPQDTFNVGFIINLCTLFMIYFCISLVDVVSLHH